MEVSSQPEPHEAEQQPHQQAFNLSALTTEQIARLNQALWAIYLETEDKLPPGEHPTIENDLFGMLDHAFKELVATDLDRGREVMMAMATSEDPYNRTTAADWVPTLA